MLDIKFVRENKELVKENIKKKFQNEKLELVDKVIELDQEYRSLKTSLDELRSQRNKISDQIGQLMREGMKEEGLKKKEEVTLINEEIKKNEDSEVEKQAEIKKIMMTIPNIIDESVPIGKDDTENVEIEKFGEPIVPNYEVPYHADILERMTGLDKESSGRTSGNG